MNKKEAEQIAWELLGITEAAEDVSGAGAAEINHRREKRRAKARRVSGLV